MSADLALGLAIVAVLLTFPLAWLLGAAFAVIQHRLSGGSLLGAGLVLLLCAADGVAVVWLASIPVKGDVPNIHISTFWTVVMTCAWVAGVVSMFSEGKGLKLNSAEAETDGASNDDTATAPASR